MYVIVTLRYASSDILTVSYYKPLIRLPEENTNVILPRFNRNHTYTADSGEERVVSPRIVCGTSFSLQQHTPAPLEKGDPQSLYARFRIALCLRNIRTAYSGFIGDSGCGKFNQPSSVVIVAF